MVDDLKNVKSIVGGNVRFIRKRKNLSLKALAKKSNYNRNAISELEKGNRDISIDRLIKLSEALDISLPDLISRNIVDDYEEDKFRFVNDDYLNVYISNVKKRLKKLGKYQYALNVDGDISVSTISRIFKGNISNPRISTLVIISNLIEVPIDKLFRRQED